MKETQMSKTSQTHKRRGQAGREKIPNTADNSLSCGKKMQKRPSIHLLQLMCYLVSQGVCPDFRSSIQEPTATGKGNGYGLLGLPFMPEFCPSFAQKVNAQFRGVTKKFEEVEGRIAKKDNIA
jgi:hypothetical protein